MSDDLRARLHGEIMNIQPRGVTSTLPVDLRRAYMEGHRDARHDAAGLVVAALSAPGEPCRAVSPVGSRECSKSKGHDGEHVSVGPHSITWAPWETAPISGKWSLVDVGITPQAPVFINNEQRAPGEPAPAPVDRGIWPEHDSWRGLAGAPGEPTPAPVDKGKARPNVHDWLGAGAYRIYNELFDWLRHDDGCPCANADEWGSPSIIECTCGLPNELRVAAAALPVTGATREEPMDELREAFKALLTTEPEPEDFDERDIRPRRAALPVTGATRAESEYVRHEATQELSPVEPRAQVVPSHPQSAVEAAGGLRDSSARGVGDIAPETSGLDLLVDCGGYSAAPIPCSTETISQNPMLFTVTPRIDRDALALAPCGHSLAGTYGTAGCQVCAWLDGGAAEGRYIAVPERVWRELTTREGQ